MHERMNVCKLPLCKLWAERYGQSVLDFLGPSPTSQQPGPSLGPHCGCLGVPCAVCLSPDLSPSGPSLGGGALGPGPPGDKGWSVSGPSCSA